MRRGVGKRKLNYWLWQKMVRLSEPLPINITPSRYEPAEVLSGYSLLLLLLLFLCFCCCFFRFLENFMKF